MTDARHIPTIANSAIFHFCLQRNEMIQTSIETLIPINQVPVHLEKITGKRPHIASIYRWIQKGIAGVQLETLIIGGTRLTSTEALDRFFQESTKAKESQKQKSRQSANSRYRSFEKQAENLGI